MNTTVLFVPDYSETIPYQWRLASALGDRGVEVVLSQSLTDLSAPGHPDAGGDPDVLHLHWMHPFLAGADAPARARGGLAFLSEVNAARDRGVRIVWTIHNLFDHERAEPLVERHFNGLLARVADRILVHDRSAIDAVIRGYGLAAAVRDKFRVVPQGHYIDCYPNEVPRNVARERLGLSGGETVFLCFGQIRPYKGIPELVAAFGALAEPHARLLIVGRPANEEAGQYVLDCCRRDGRIQAALDFVPAPNVQDYFNAADAVVLPYRDILTSGAAMLAMSFARAVIAPRIGGIPEVLNDRGAILYAGGENVDLSAALRAAMSADLPAMGRYNHERVQGLGWERVAGWTHDVYREVLPAGAATAGPPTKPRRVTPADAWACRQRRAARRIRAELAPGETIALIDDGQCPREELGSCGLIVVQERDGADWGPPADDEAALEALDRARREGATRLVIASPAFWWLEHYRRFSRHLHERFRMTSISDEFITFDISDEFGRLAGAGGQHAAEPPARTVTGDAGRGR